MTRKLFPKPAEVTDVDRVAWRSSEDIIEIYNEANGGGRKYTSLAEAVRDWVREQARSEGWEAVYFPIAYPYRSTYAGAVFLKKTK